MTQATSWLFRMDMTEGAEVDPDVWHDLLAGHAASGDIASAMVVMTMMERRRSDLLVPGAYNLMMDGLLHTCPFAGAAAFEHWAQRMTRHDVVPDDETKALMVLAWLREGNSTSAARWFRELTFERGPWRPEGGVFSPRDLDSF